MTSPSIRSLPVRDPEELAFLVEENLPALEPGLSLLGRRFPAGRVLVDFLAQDARERLVLLMLGSGSDAAMLVQALDRKSTRLNSSHIQKSRMPSSA